MDILEKLNSPSRFAILRDFKNQEYQFTIPKTRIRLTEKREEREKENMQLQSAMRFAQA